MTLSCSEVDSWVVYGETDGFIARWSSDYPSILVQRQGIQQQKVPRVMQTLDEGCCKCGRVDVACVPKQNPLIFRMKGQLSAIARVC